MTTLFCLARPGHSVHVCWGGCKQTKCTIPTVFLLFFCRCVVLQSGEYHCHFQGGVSFWTGVMAVGCGGGGGGVVLGNGENTALTIYKDIKDSGTFHFFAGCGGWVGLLQHNEQQKTTTMQQQNNNIDGFTHSLCCHMLVVN